ncbi:glycosyltransferase family 2 protein [Pseudomonas sp.]|uniref:glycosyltransferase family 2 protein n=1 Tax=Pseudomonas sp. TaxID=306 RepID=UPI00299D2638|nr:glycosyltransferase [Pseudomonas sp.]MDX1366007.1 glycosyltransferase [Pseudomonas sp.]
MSTSLPRVSVILPMRNADAFVEATLKSILLEVTVALEVVVINDLSTDCSLERVLSFRDSRIRIIDGLGAGISAALNLGLAAARGNIVMRCDADDLYPVSRIRDQVAWLDSNQDFAAVCGGFATLDGAGRLVAKLATGETEEDITEELKSGNTRTSFCSYAVRKSAIDRVGGFRAYFETAEDIDFQLRLANVCRVMYLPQVVYQYRLHETSITHTQSNSKRIFFEETARAFQVQRRMDGQDDLQRGYPPTVPDGGAGKPGGAAQQIGGMLMGAAWRAHQGGNKLEAIVLGLRALTRMPFDVTVWRSVVALIGKSAKH